MILQAVQGAALTVLTRINCMTAVNDLEVAGEAIHKWVVRTPFMYTLF